MRSIGRSFVEAAADTQGTADTVGSDLALAQAPGRR
jgi:hypothetical protein